MSTGAYDFFGNEIKVGDTVAHVARSGSSLWIDKKVVSKVKGDKVWTVWPDAKFTETVKYWEEMEAKYHWGDPKPVNRPVYMQYNNRLIVQQFPQPVG